jgi:hypothetical protein
MLRLFSTTTKRRVRGEPVRAARLAGQALVLALVTAPLGAQAVELVMFEDPGCPWCRRWHAEIGSAYPLTAEGQIAPLRRVDIRDQAAAGVSLAQPVTATPTFVLADEGREVGRIVGYPGTEFFYPLLGDLLKRLPESNNSGRAEFASARNALCCGQLSYDECQVTVDTRERLSQRTSTQ